jgi:3-keto-5-aminohexanoate cleavage enzyme
VFGDLRKTWLEVALRGGSVDAVIDTGVSCAMAGAAILQVHAADVASYARIIEGIRGEIDAIVYPAPQAGESALPVIDELARLGLIEWMPIIPGSANLATYDALRDDRPGTVLLNPEMQIREALRLARRHALHPAYAIHEPGFIRLGATLYWRESPPAPLYRFLFSGDSTFSFPAEDYGLTAYLKLLDQVAPGAQWMVAGCGADILPLVPRVVAEGGHVQVGFSDTGDSAQREIERAEQAAQAIRDCGGELAAAREVRAALSPEE